MSDPKFMGHASGMTNIEVTQSLEYNAPHARALWRGPSRDPLEDRVKFQRAE
jgi:hypothetical protein